MKKITFVFLTLLLMLGISCENEKPFSENILFEFVGGESKEQIYDNVINRIDELGYEYDHYEIMDFILETETTGLLLYVDTNNKLFVYTIEYLYNNKELSNKIDAEIVIRDSIRASKK